MNKFRPFLISIQFLTRIPVPRIDNITEKEIGRSLLFYPLSGLLIGLFLVAIAWAGSNASNLLTAALILTGWVLITGALHLDGLADSADAWLGGNGDKERTLEIMKDPRSGPVAVVIVVMILLLKFSAIEAIISNGNPIILILAPIIGRTCMPLLLLTTPYVRSNGLGTTMVEYLPSAKHIYIMCLLTCLLVLFFGGTGLVVLITSACGFFLIRRLMIKRIDGTTGDTAGAMLETIETAILITIALTLTD
ncbi:MAG: adenosylcobinamide-GDP ribazoletransferase [Gammaproteobacteria bacterium]|nr:adenosylcobinamide-GDP ribazoletransferase [Gammaproteobacteria bacterium]